MPLEKPYYRCYRSNIKETNVKYLRDNRNVKNPYDYIRKLEILYSRLEKIFEFVEPEDSNGDTYSIQLSSLLLDICTTIEANFRSILDKNGYKKDINKNHEKDMKNWNINDYYKVNISHHLSSYEIKIPFWKGSNNIRNPYEIWGSSKNSPKWYQSYNHVKHNMIGKFNEATLDTVVNSFCGLVILISAQFYDDTIIKDDDMFEEIKMVFGDNGGKGIKITDRINYLVYFPKDWSEDEKYDFKWKEIKDDKESFEKYSY
ncbi:MAG: hypothetical protein ACPKMZ_01940 [Pleomorphochaeta sp.]